MSVTSPLRWLFTNLGTLILAFALAVVVWFSAETAANPNIESNRSVPLEIFGLDPNMLVVGSPPAQVRVTLRSPTSVMNSLDSVDGSITAWVDVAGLEAGTYELEVHAQASETYGPVRVTAITPQFVTLTLEPLITRSLPVDLVISGDPAIGYQKGIPSYTPDTVTVSGAASVVNQVSSTQVALDISEADETIDTTIPVLALDANGEPVEGLLINPKEISVTQPVYLQGGYRNVIVKVLTTGQPANGYKLTNITVSPLNVVVFASDPQLVNDLPGFVETEPVDLTGSEDDVDTFAALQLPEGVSVVGDETVLVQVSIAAIEGSLTMELPVTPIGLLPTQAALLSPETVQVILSGPVPVLDSLEPSDIRVVVDLTGLELGAYQLEPQVDLLPDRLRADTILPSTIEVTVIIAPTPTPTSVFTPLPTTTPQP
jgi:YbbR domain-containing protein